MLAGLLPLASAAAHTEGAPYTVDLVADGGADVGGPVVVGDVEVWNDADYLYVDYKITDGAWCITKTHVAVATDPLDLPQTKKNNPIPGKFAYSAVHDCVTEYGYMIPIPLGVVVGEPLAIAAHANVWSAAVTETLTLSDATHGIMVYGSLDHYAAPGHADWGIPMPAVETWKHSAWPLLPDSDAIWISNTYKIGDLEGDSIAANSWRWFSDDFDVPGYPIGAYVVKATADNAEEVYLNGAFVGSDGEVQGSYVDNHEWGTILHYGITPTMGTNTLDFIVRNYPGSSSPTSNPTGLIYEVEVEYLARGETAWGDGTDGTEFGGKQWGMYFGYTVQEVLFETILVPSDGAVVSSAALVDGATYELRASGTYRFAGWEDAGIADAQCSLRKAPYIPDGYTPDPITGFAWVNGEDLGSVNYLEVWMDDVSVDWNPGTCQDDHLYNGAVPGEGIALEFFIPDSCGGGVLGCYGDNSGFITVEIWWMGNG